MNRHQSPAASPRPMPMIRWIGNLPALLRLPASSGPDPAGDDFEPHETLRRPAIAGIGAIVIGFGGFMLWASTATIDSAAVANGTVIVDAKKKTVSHLEGGVLKRVLVAEGDKVTTGQPLIELDGTRATADVDAGKGERVGLVAKLARLRAEQESTAEIAFPAELAADQSPIAAAVMANERQLFSTRRDVYRGKRSVAENQIAQFVAEGQAAAAQATAAAEQQVLISAQLESIRGLVAKGIATEKEASDLEGQLSQAIGNVGSYTAQKAKADQEKAGAEVALLSVKMEWQGDIATDIQDTQLKLNDTEQRMAAAEDVLDRLTLRAPADGTVLNIQVHTPGSAVAAGEPLLDIEPDNEPMVVEAQLRPIDIDVVHVGGQARIMLTGYNMRTHPALDSHLTYVAADQTEDAQRGTAYYTVRASIDAAALAAHPATKLYPGMPAELIVTQEPRKAIDYILDPLTRTFYRAFRED